jgi:hypothetical protein
MKTVVAFTMALATVVSATAADADGQGQRCGVRVSLISARAGTPCVFGSFGPSALGPAAFRQGLAPWKGMMLHSTEIVEPPHEGTAVVRPDGRIYYSQTLASLAETL